MGEIRIENVEMSKALAAGLRVTEPPLTIRTLENGAIEIEDHTGHVMEITTVRED